MVCFAANFINDGDMTMPLVLLIFMFIIVLSWRYKKRKNEERWGRATRTGQEVFRIGMTQPTKEEKMGIKPEAEPKAKKKKKNAKKGNFRH